MDASNPYKPPSTPLSVASTNTAMQRLAGAQKLIIYAILLYLASVFLSGLIHPLFLLLALAGPLLGIVGIVRMAGALGLGVVAQVLFGLLMFVPLVNLITLLTLNARATGKLRGAGYRVGLFGASPP